MAIVANDMKIYFLLNMFVLCIDRAQMFKQHEYNVIHHHVELGYVNNTMIEGTLKNVKPNRTYRAFDADFLLKVELYGNQFKVRVHTFYFVSREYKRSPIQFDFGFCKAVEKNLFGVKELLKNFPNATCPVKPGQYAIHNFNVPDESLPPNILEGDYMVQFIGFWGKSIICEFKWFGSVVYKVKKRNPF